MIGMEGAMSEPRFYSSSPGSKKHFINKWDIAALLIIIGVLFIFASAAMQMSSPYQVGKSIPISLDVQMLPAYAIRTVLRMAIALVFSLLFTFSVGALAAKSHRSARIIIPMIDVLQSIPVLSFLSITVVPLIALFHGSLLGPECAAILAIFTAQVWNMTLGFYQSLRTVPADIIEAAQMFHLSAWQRFWRVEVPFSMSSLLWNTMMSMSASWFFVVASEAISVANQDIHLPGIGSYIAVAIEQANFHAVGYAIGAMLIVILFYDQLLFRPLLAWSEKFKFDAAPDESPATSWFVDLLQHTRLLKIGGHMFASIGNNIINFSWLNRPHSFVDKPRRAELTRIYNGLLNVTILVAVLICLYILWHFITASISIYEIADVATLGLATALRVFILIILSSLIWVPIGIAIARRPRLTQLMQPIIQFVASFPAYLLFPLVVIVIVRYHLNVEIWTSPLMILGSQWYILFNVIAGASTLPKELYMAADNLGLRGWQWWKRLALPGIFPFFITGAITAAGGAWNASIVAEWVSWGHTTLRATGLGEYITASTLQGDFPRIALGTAMMCIYVLVFNRLIWQPLYRLAEERFGF